MKGEDNSTDIGVIQQQVPVAPRPPTEGSTNGSDLMTALRRVSGLSPIEPTSILTVLDQAIALFDRVETGRAERGSERSQVSGQQPISATREPKEERLGQPEQ